MTRSAFKRPAAALIALCFLLVFQNASAVWEFVDKPFTGKYVIYGGYLNDSSPPAQGDTKVAFTLKGKPAKELFDAMPPDRRGGCGTEDGGRVRERGTLSCRYDKKFGYTCDFGFDLTTGKTIRGSDC